MASFDPHDWCARCREKVIGSDPCVHGEEPCKFSVVLIPEQIHKLSILKYKIRKEKKAEACKDTERIDPQDISVIKAVSPLKNRPSSAPVSASVISATVSSPSSDLDKCLDNLQDEWSTCFARIEALLTMKSKTDAVFSPVKASVHKARSPEVRSSVSKTPFFYPSVSDWSGLDQVPEDQQDFKMKSPLDNLYVDSNLEREPLLSTTSCAPAGSAAGLEVDDREDISEGELVTSSGTELPQDQDNIQTEDQSYRETVRAVRFIWGGTLFQTLSLLLQVLLITPGLEVTLNQLARFLLLSLLKNGFVKNLKI